MASLDLRDESGRWPVSRLIRFSWPPGSSCLVLDNCEHLINAGAPSSPMRSFVKPGGRADPGHEQDEPLGIAGETVIAGGTRLSVPVDSGHFTPELVAQTDAVALLVGAR